MKFVPAKDAQLIPGQMYRIAQEDDLDKDNNLLSWIAPPKKRKFVRRQDRAAIARANGAEPMDKYPPEVVFLIEDEYGERERAFRESETFVESSSDIGTQSSSSDAAQGGKHRRGKKKTARRNRRRSTRRKH